MEVVALKIRLIALLLAALLLALPVSAGEQPEQAPESAQSVVEEFMTEYDLKENNFALWFYNPVSGEEYSFNGDAMMVAASTYKLPLNLYYYDLERAGQVTGDTIITEVNQDLRSCHRDSLLWSNNEVSMGMLHQLGGFRAYKDAMLTYFTTPVEEIPVDYYLGNSYSVHMMADALKHLYAHQEQYSEMLSYLKQAMRGAYFTRLVGSIPVAHKYGSFEGAENDTGIFWADEPFLLAVYTWRVGLVEPYPVAEDASEERKAYYTAKKEEYDGVVAQLEAGAVWSSGENVCAHAAKVLCDYVNRSAKRTREAAAAVSKLTGVWDSLRKAQLKTMQVRLAAEEAQREQEEAAARAVAEHEQAVQARQEAEAEKARMIREELAMPAEPEPVPEAPKVEPWRIAAAVGVVLAAMVLVVLLLRKARQFVRK